MGMTISAIIIILLPHIQIGEYLSFASINS